MPSEYMSIYGEIESSAESSKTPSRPGSPGEYPGGQQKKQSRVRFNSTSEANDTGNKRFSIPLQDTALNAPKNTRTSPLHSRNSSTAHLLRHTPETKKENPFEDASFASPVLKPRPGVLRNSSYGELPDLGEVNNNEKSYSALAAQERAQRITASLVRGEAQGSSRRPSLDENDSDDDLASMKPDNGEGFLVNIPLGQLDSRRTYDGPESDEETRVDRKKKVKSSSMFHIIKDCE